jgi:hypothetical protein
MLLYHGSPAAHGFHARIVNAAHFGNLFTTGPTEFIRYYK